MVHLMSMSVTVVALHQDMNGLHYSKPAAEPHKQKFYYMLALRRQWCEADRILLHSSNPESVPTHCIRYGPLRPQVKSQAVRVPERCDHAIVGTRLRRARCRT